MTAGWVLFVMLALIVLAVRLGDVDNARIVRAVTMARGTGQRHRTARGVARVPRHARADGR